MRDSEATYELITQGMAHAGIDVNEVYGRLARSGYLLSKDGRFHHSTHTAFWQILEEMTEDSDIGLRLCPHLPIYRGRVFEYLFLSAANYEQGLNTAFRYQRLVSDAFHVRLEKDSEGARIMIEGAAGDAPELRHTEVCTTYAFLQAMSVVTDARFQPIYLRLRCQTPRPTAPYERLFGCPVEFVTGESEIWIDPALLKCRSPHTDADMLKLHKKYADNQLAQLARQDLMDDVYEYLKRQFAETDGVNGAAQTLPEVAEAFGVSARHLRFVLSEAGTSFRAVLKDARFGFACRTLKRTSEPVEEIAYRAGFSEPSTFCRAFKQWSGLTPYQFRETKQAAVENRPRARDRLAVS